MGERRAQPTRRASRRRFVGVGHPRTRRHVRASLRGARRPIPSSARSTEIAGRRDGRHDRGRRRAAPGCGRRRGTRAGTGPGQLRQGRDPGPRTSRHDPRGGGPLRARRDGPRGPGVYRETVTVTVPYLTIRGQDRNETILDGASSWPTVSRSSRRTASSSRTSPLATSSSTASSGRGCSATEARISRRTTTATTACTPSTLASAASTIRTRAARRTAASTSAGATLATPSSPTCSPSTTCSGTRGRTQGATSRSSTASGGTTRAGIVPNTLDSEPSAPQRGALIAGNYVHDNNDRGRTHEVRRVGARVRQRDHRGGRAGQPGHRQPRRRIRSATASW